MHVIDGLGGGGSERWVWDIVRLSDKDRTVYRVVPIHFDRGRFVYADRLRAAGALPSRHVRSRRAHTLRGGSKSPDTRAGSRTLIDRVPGLNRVGIALWHNACVFPAAAARLLASCAAFRPDVLHAHTFYGLVAGLKASRLLRRPLVYSVPSSFQHIAEADYGWILDIYRTQNHRIDRFLTNYPSELLGLGIPSTKITVIRAAADVGRIDSLRSARTDYRQTLRARLGISANGPLALTVGRLDPEKGLRFGLEALPGILETCPDFHWAIIGAGHGRTALEEAAVQLGVADRVHFLGFVDDPLPWYFAADIYLRTHVLEGDNLSSVQAMAASLPVAGFDTGSEGELIREVGHGLLAQNRDSGALARVVLTVIRSADRARMGERGALFASANLDTRRVVDQCQAMYEHLSGSIVRGLAVA